MKTEKWYFIAQKLFKQWKINNAKTGDCLKQEITQYSLIENWTLYPKDGGTPTEYILHAYKGNGEVYILPKYGLTHFNSNRKLKS